MSRKHPQYPASYVCTVGYRNDGTTITGLRSNLPIAKVEKPLRYIRAKCAKQVLNKGEIRLEYSRPYPAAVVAAKLGRGNFVQYYATKHANTGTF